jgi:V8-like Glu-specific endopeptidase
MTLRSASHWLLLSTCLVLGCAADPPIETTATSKSAIIGGQPDDAEGPVVWMVGDLDGRIGYCSAVVVSPHVVLTAGHCAAPNAKFEIFLGADYNDETAKAAPENHVAVVSHKASPDYDSYRHLHDIGVLVTATPIPRTAAVINREAIVKADVGRPLRISGFGRTVADDEAIGRRHEAMTTLDGYDAMSLGMKGTPSFCLFDSGGPTFMDRGAGEVVVGIHSIVESQACDALAWDARVDIDAEFIDGIIAKADPPPDTTTVEQPTEPADEPAGASPAPTDASGPTTQTTSSCTIGAPRPPSGNRNGNGAAFVFVAFAACLGLRARYPRARDARRDRSRIERR